MTLLKTIQIKKLSYCMLRYFYFLTSILFLACKSKQIIKPNQAPSAVIVTSTLAPNGKDLILNWTKSEDPDGDAVTYSVIYKDTLAKGLKETTFIIKDLPFGTSLSGAIVVTDTKGLTSSTSFSSETASAFVKIPDPEFEQELINQKIDDIKDGQISIANAEKVTELKINYSLGQTFSKITNLDGIEAFVNLEGLYLERLKLTKDLNIQDNDKLKILVCHILNFISLDISKNLNLTSLWVTNNQRINLDVTKNVKLTSLWITNIELSNLDVSKNINLTSLRIVANKLSNIDVSKNLKLTELHFVENNLTKLDVSKNVNLINLVCSGTQISDLDVSKNVNLTILNCGGNQLKTLDVSKNMNLEELNCGGNKLTTLNVSKNANLTGLHCANNQLTAIDVSKNVNLSILSCIFNQISNLDVSKNVKLIRLVCSYNKLPTLDVSKNINLSSLECAGNQLTTLDLSKNLNLTHMFCLQNYIKTICVADLNQPTSDWRKNDNAEYKVCN